MSPSASLLMRRIRFREQARIQAEFLALLNQQPESQQMILYGSSALHGVYLHERFTGDFDLHAPPALVQTIRTAPHLFPVPLQLCPSPSGGTLPAYVRPSTVYGEIGIVIDASSHDFTVFETVEAQFTTASKQTVPVRTLTLAKMLAMKVDCFSSRERAVDLADLWSTLR